MRTFIIIVLMATNLVTGFFLSQEMQKNEPYVQTVKDLSDSLSDVTKQLKQSTCVIEVMTKVMQQDSITINALDGMCRNFIEEQELKACVRAVIKDHCGMENY